MSQNPRYEVKIVFEESRLDEIRAGVLSHPVGFFETYPAREVNNIYFDTPDYARFYENTDGLCSRKKYRLRWYGETNKFEKSVFEIKIKRNRFNHKVSNPIDAVINLESMEWNEIIMIIRDNLAPDIALQFDTNFIPTVINRYKREYYESFDRAVRITLDYSQRSYLQYGGAPNIFDASPSEHYMTIEIKADMNNAASITEVFEHLPYRAYKNSKYVNSLKRLILD